MPKVSFRVINPSPRKKRRSKNKHKKRLNKSRKGATLIMAKSNKRRGRKRSRRKTNPGTHTKTASRTSNKKGRKKGTRRRRNPEGGVMDPTKGTNILQLGAGAAGGAVVVPIVGNMLGFEGPSKYFAQIAVSVAGHYGLKMMGMPKAGLAFLIAGVAVTAYQAAQDYGILAGIENTLLGWTSNDVSNMQLMAGAVPYGQLNGMVPGNQPVQLVNPGSMQGNGAAAYAGDGAY